MNYIKLIFIFIFTINISNAYSPYLGYWDLEDIAPEIKKSTRYYGSDNFQGKDSENFMGKRIEMYHHPRIK